MSRIEREKKIVSRMITIYCRRNHGRSTPCEECSELAAYAKARLDRCPHGNAKRSCRKCSIHCYSPAKRQQIRRVMRTIGPRMMFYNPIAALRHLIDEMR